MGRREQFTVGELTVTEALKIGDTNVSTTELAVLDGLTASAAELNKLDNVTAGTVTASKAVVVGAQKNVDVLAVADLKLGAGAGTSVTATAAEINKLASSGAVVASGTASANIPDLKADYIKTDLDDSGAIDGTEIAAALCLTNAKINTIITLLEGFKIASAT
jgi:hypothetical protein